MSCDEMNRWKVRRARRSDGSLYRVAIAWNVWNPEGTWMGTLATWAEAMEWATSFAAHVEHWLQQEPTPQQRQGYWGQPDDRDDMGYKR